MGRSLNSVDILRNDVNIDMNARTVSNNNPDVLHVIMLDSCRSQYGQDLFWKALIKPDILNDFLPENIRFILSSTYSLADPLSPVVFKDLPRLTHSDLILSLDESRQFMQLCAQRFKDYRFSEFLLLDDIFDMVTINCNGNIGALKRSVLAFRDRFRSVKNVTVEDLTSYYLLAEMSSDFSRCYVSGITSLPAPLRDYLLICLRDGSVQIPSDSFTDDELSGETYLTFVRSGLLCENTDGHVTFTSPAACKYINALLIPYRLDFTIDSPKKLFELIENVICQMSTTALRQSMEQIVQSDSPSEAMFRHFILTGLKACTPVTWWICPELSRYFPKRSSARDCSSRGIEGRCDFYIDGYEVCWAIEVLINGVGIHEHSGRFEEEGDKYIPLKYNDWVVVDFRITENGEPTVVRAHANKITVFFKRYDFRQCKVIFGESLKPVTIKFVAPELKTSPTPVTPCMIL